MSETPTALNKLNPKETMDQLLQGSIREVAAYFPHESEKFRLEVNNIRADNPLHPDDVHSQYAAKTRGRTWATKVVGDVKIIDKATSRIVAKSDGLQLFSIPAITRRYSYIVDGAEYQPDNQTRLKSGVYARRKANGELEAQFNLAEGRGFTMQFEPERSRFALRYGTTNIPLVPILRALGVSDKEMKAAWGTQAADSIMAHRDLDAINKMVKVLDKKASPRSDADKQRLIKERLAETKLLEDTTQVTLGKPFSQVDGQALLRTSQKLLNINRGVEDVDDRNSYRFKALWDISDHIPERIRNSKRDIKRKLGNGFDRKAAEGNIRSILDRSLFQVPIKSFFTMSDLAQQPDQNNPVQMLGGHLRLTVMGAGGIGTDRAITLDAKGVNASQLGFVDPVYTPEGARSGVTTHLTIGATKIGNEAAIKVINTRTGKEEFKTPVDLYNAVVAFPDEYTTNNKGKLVPRTAMVKAIRPRDTDPIEIPAKDVDYVIRSGSSLLSVATNLVPFLPSDQANRAGMADRHLEQAISLKNREEPLIQVASSNSDPAYSSWEKIFGRIAAHTAPVSGKVVRVDENQIVIQDTKGKQHVSQLYKNFPLNEKKSFISSEPTVEVGDQVKAGDLIADTNFTRGGTLSLGVNLRAAYLPYKGLVFEDGIVISETASKKLTSLHMHKLGEYVGRDVESSLKKFRALYPGKIDGENAEKLDETGVVKVGQKIKPGEVMAALLRKKEPTKDQMLLRGVHKSLVKPFKDASIVWEKPFVGEVVAVHRHGRKLDIHVRTEEPADIGDKLSGRHGNKGVITAVIPDEDMPHDKDGEPIDIIMNPAGVPGRINPSQVLETNLAKVADKEGVIIQVTSFPDSPGKVLAKERPRTVKVKGHFRTIKTNEGTKRIWIEPYEYDTGYEGLVRKAMAEANVEDTTELIDPETGHSFGQVMVGKQYIIKQTHQVGKKLSARAHGYGYAYDQNNVPRSSFGGGDGAQRFGELGLYAMLAHGATHNIRDGLTYKSDRTQEAIWDAIQSGSVPPAPRESFAFGKFLAYLKALGLNVEKSGHELSVMPLTDKQITEMSSGELANPERMVIGKNLSPEKGGMFDEEITGGVRGERWSHFKLAEPMPNPIFERSLLALFGLRGRDYDAIMEGKAGFDEKGDVDPDAKVKGARAIIERIKKFDEGNLDQMIEEAREETKNTRGANRDKARKRLKFMLALKKAGVRAEDAYVLKNVPVLPPHYRPVSVMETGDLNIDGLNNLYRDVALLNGKRKDAEGVLPPSMTNELTKEVYDALEALFGVNPPSQPGALLDGSERPPGVLTILSGRTTPKNSFFHKKLLDRKQDLTMRTVIVPDMNLHLDEVGIPRKAAMKIFRPYVVRELSRMGMSPLQAREEIEKDTKLAQRALEVVANKTPVMFKRDPVLHKFGIMGFMPKLVDGKSLRIHPLTVSGFNADFDGDQMAIFVPVSQQAKDEVYKMFPSKNLFSPATGKVEYQPGLEGQMGMFLITAWGKESGKTYSSQADLLKAHKAGEIEADSVATVAGKKTTAGRVMLNNILPPPLRSDSILYDPDRVMGKSNLQALMRGIALKTPEQFAATIDKIKELGFGHSHNIGFSFTMADFSTLRDIRDKYMQDAKKAVAKLPANMTATQREQRIVDIYSKATDGIDAEAKKYLAETNNAIYKMTLAGVKPSWSQLRQLVIAPMLLENSEGRVIPVPVDRSYTEGLTSAGYWTASSGARKGLIEKVQSVSEPGALSKQIVNTTIPYVVTTEDCGTTNGIALDKSDDDVLDRALYRDLKVGDMVYKAGTLLNSSMVSHIRADDSISKVPVRSTHRCEAKKGLCAKCYGAVDDGRLIEVGTNIGIIAGQAVGERGTQLSMKTFHTGGVAGSSGGVVGGLERVTQLLKMPKILPNKAKLADIKGEVTEIKPSPVGGYDVKVNGVNHYVSGGKALRVKVGDTVRAGDALSDGPIDPRELLERTDIQRVRGYLTDEIHSVYEKEGIKRRNVEVVVKSLTDLGVVTDVGDVGDANGVITGDYIQLSAVRNLNKQAGKDQKPIKAEPILRGVETLALDRTTDWLARMQYRNLRETLVGAANEGWTSDIHGTHPVPGIVYSKEFGLPPSRDPEVKTPY